ncbi:hypothetical protein OEA41_004837 [Lepraria neglecta]|uniref:Protein kinase domain-containing protein n=1 Tax=Lepraria neglecta TaxID=209136 RepID=A0AAD9YZD3_9LECA|nr:hypothetical protein OEA41_004837 [Lepraria neglecta]
MSAIAPPRMMLRHTRFIARQTSRRHASTTEAAKDTAAKPKETASNIQSKASQGLSRVTSSAGPALSGAAQGVSNAAGRIGGRTGRLIGFVQCDDKCGPRVQGASGRKKTQKLALGPLPKLVALLAERSISGPWHLRERNLRAVGSYRASGGFFDIFDDATDVVTQSVYRRSWGFDYPSFDNFDLRPFMMIEKAIGSLKIFLERKSPLTVVKHQLCLDVAEGLRHVHSRNIVHGDLKPDNVLVVESANPHVPFIAKLADFGAYIEICLPNSTSMTYSSYTGTRGWKPPEVYEDGTRWSEVRPFVPDSIEDWKDDTSIAQPLATVLRLRVFRLLSHKPKSRPEVSPELLCDDSETYRNWASGKKLLERDPDPSNPALRSWLGFWKSMDSAFLSQLYRENDTLSDQMCLRIIKRLFNCKEAISHDDLITKLYGNEPGILARDKGTNVLMVAISNAHLETVKFLLRPTIDLQILSMNGLSILDYALNNAELLRRRGLERWSTRAPQGEPPRHRGHSKNRDPNSFKELFWAGQILSNETGEKYFAIMDIVELIIERGGKSQSLPGEDSSIARPRQFDAEIVEIEDWGNLYKPGEQPYYDMWKPLYEFDESTFNGKYYLATTLVLPHVH